MGTLNSTYGKLFSYGSSKEDSSYNIYKFADGITKVQKIAQFLRKNSHVFHRHHSRPVLLCEEHRYMFDVIARRALINPISNIAVL